MDESHLRAQLEVCHPESFGWALSCCAGNRSEAEDVLQAVYLKVLQQRASFDGRSSFKTWLFSVIRRTAAQAWRKRILHGILLGKHQQQREAPAPPPRPDASLLQAERENGFRKALDALSGRQGQVIHLVFFQDMTIHEAAIVMGVSLGSARQHYERAKANLRQKLALEKQGDEPRSN